MTYPTVTIADRKLIVLLGSEADLEGAARRVQTFGWRDLPSSERLRQAARKNPDAVAFGFVRGQWFAAA